MHSSITAALHCSLTRFATLVVGTFITFYANAEPTVLRLGEASDLENFELYRGYDMFSGVPLQSCFSFQNEWVPSANSHLTATMRDTQSKESRRKQVTKEISAKAGGKLGPFKASAKLAYSQSLDEAFSNDSRSIQLNLDWQVRTGVRRGKAVSLNELGASALAEGAGAFIKKCGYAVPTSLEQSIGVAAVLRISFVNTESKRNFLSNFSASAEGEYAGIGGAISGSGRLKEELAKSNAEKSIDVSYRTRSAQGTKGAGEAILALSSAQDDPFKASWASVGNLVKGLEGDEGSISSVTLTPVADLVPELNGSAGQIQAQFATSAADYLIAIDLLHGAAVAVREHWEDFNGKPADRVARAANSNAAYEPIKERLLADYVSGHCWSTRNIVTLFRLLCERETYRQFTSFERRLAEFERQIRELAIACLQGGSDTEVRCAKAILVDAFLRSGLLISVGDLSSHALYLDLPSANSGIQGLEVLGDLARAADIMEAKLFDLQSNNKSYYLDEKWLWFNFLDPSFVVKDVEWYLSDLTSHNAISYWGRNESMNTRIGPEWAVGPPRPPQTFSVANSERISIPLASFRSSEINEINFAFRSPMLVTRLVAEQSGATVQSCNLTYTELASTGWVGYFGKLYQPGNGAYSLEVSLVHGGNLYDCSPSDLLFSLAGKAAAARLPEFAYRIYSEGRDFWGPTRRFLGTLRGSAGMEGQTAGPPHYRWLRFDTGGGE
ncbi:hypothetical protein [Mesorhizobium sp.]|uniref:hypothetical protein n=1 Tax=Mesorhizobium sp. TaxID=1871066 RepID=UPI0011FECBB1|nr:hypothetical protein [Mesorhizobium sp.]TIN24014.1 MAG: hypothetical protein E5Y19_24100 [Mesorhizobium sp.]